MLYLIRRNINITIIGAGAMGSLFGFLLARSGENVLLIDIWQEHVNTINSKGLGVEFGGKTNKVDINASTNIENTPKSDLVIILYNLRRQSRQQPRH
ncbi:MAG: 2-dehydropantoate 2-reductase N-terminal domain-containing protein [Thermodesulfobacteriota bacterium]